MQFIATVLHRPQLLIFDEPFSGFDPVNAEQLKTEILRLRDEGATILFSTHNMESVEQICERITLIDKSRVVLEGAVDEVKQRYKKNLYTVQLAGGAKPEAVEGLFSIEETAANTTIIRLCKDASVRDVIACINAHYDITAFSELLPSMNEIFIETVTHDD